MNTWKKTAAVTAVLALAASLGACGRGGDAGGDKDVKATLVISTLNNPFFVSVVDGAKQAAKDGGVDLDVQNANNSDQTALNATTTALTKKPSVLIIDPVGSKSGGTMTKAANKADVPVVAFDRAPDSGTLESFIGYDAVQAGREAAKSLAESIGEKGKVVEIQGILGTNVAQDRSKGFNEGIKKYPGITVVAKQAADFDRGKALDVMTNVLQGNSDIDGVYAANDEMALGVVAALKSRNLAGKVKVVGNDGIGDALKAIEAGTMYSTHAESPFVLGKSVLDISRKVAEGEKVEKNTVLKGRLVTKDQVADFCGFLSDEGDTKTCQGIG
ncbi:MAG: substrate-binding domain-containing protein [Aeromicrobium erythreum]